MNRLPSARVKGGQTTKGVSNGPWFRGVRGLTLGAVGYGLALYLINFQILGRIAFPWFQEGPDRLFEVVAHGLFGLMLVPFFIGMRPRDAT